MATYRELHGKAVKTVTTNPTDDAAEGQIWFNSTDNTFKSVVASEATHSGTPMINKRSLYGFGVGTGTAGLVVAGIDDSTYLSVCEEWNGSGWAAGGAYPTARYSAGTAGTQTAAIAYCGRVPSSPGPGSPAETYDYNGSSWTSGNSFPTGNNSCQGIGAVNTAVVSTQASDSTNMHHWNGTSWTSANARNTAKGGQAAFGTQTAAILAGGFPDESNITEVYDGTNWTSGNTMNTGRNQIAGSGTQTDGLAFGGDKPPSEAAQTTIESWDGTSWSTSPATLATARTRSGTGRSTASGTWIAGGIGPGGGGEGFDAVEIYEKSTNSVTAAAWASGGTLNVSRKQTYGAGSQTAGLIFGGEGPSGDRNQTEEYDGSTWTAVNNMPATNKDHAGFGIQTAAVACGGSPNTTSINYDGTNWTASPGSLNTGRTNAGGTGTQTAGLTFGGYPSITATEEYGGSTWTTGGALPAAKSNIFAAGTQTAALGAGGGPPTSTNVYEYDGSSWTAGNALPSGTIDARGGGTQTDALYAGGYLHPGSGYPTTTLGYDGTNWSTRPSLAAGTAGGGSGQNAAPATANWIAGGNPSPSISATQEFTGETTTVNIEDFTTS